MASLYDLSIPVLVRGLDIGTAYINKAEAEAETRKIDPTVFIQARLAPDMLNFGRQVQLLSDAAKAAAARCADVETPSYADTEGSLPELRQRLSRTVEFVRGFTPDQINGASEHYIEMKNRLFAGKMTKTDYVLHLALPNFFFHLTTMHDILRHNGIQIGKVDYIGDLREFAT